MSAPLVRSNVSFPIQVFVEIPVSSMLDAINELVFDTNKYITALSAALPAVKGTVSQLTGVLTLEGQSGFATDGLKIGETTGTGTGVYVYYSQGSLRTFSTDAPVLT